MFRKNTIHQYIYFALVNATTGAALTGATVAGKRGIDGAAQASVTGTISEDAGGQYHLDTSAADTNGNNIGFLFTATGAIPVSITIVTTAADPTDSVRFGLTALPNAAAEAAGGLYTRGAGAGQIAQQANGQVDVNLSTIKTQAVTCGAGVTVLASVGTAATSTAQTGDNYPRIGAPAGASIAADIAAVKVDTAAVKVQTDKLTFTVANQVDSNVLDWKGSAAPAMTGDAFARLGAPAGASVSADVAAVKSDSGAIKAKTDNLPASPAAVADIPTANANADALLDRVNGVETSWTLRQAMRILLAALAGKLSGAATTTVAIRDVGDSKDRITATVDASGNRSAVSYDKT
jgi:hypothetical protein